MNNININEIQKQRLKINLSLKICENVLDDFSNTVFMEVKIIKLIRNKIKKVLKNCDINCYSKYKEIYNSNEKNSFFDFEKFKNELNDCVNKCDMIYRHVLDHQIKGAEISYVNIIYIILSIHIKNI